MSSLRTTLRAEFRAQRRALRPVQRQYFAQRAQRRLTQLPKVRNASRIALYKAFDGEPGTDWLAEWAQAQGIPVLYPRHQPKQSLIFVHPESWTTRKGYPIPSGSPAPSLTSADVIVVPGIAFDTDGYRLGFGGGYYDRTLANYPAWPVGLAFECQRVSQVPRAAWDRPVLALCTEENTYAFEPMEPNL